MPWNNIDKGSKRKIGFQFILWFVLFAAIIYVLTSFNLLI